MHKIKFLKIAIKDLNEISSFISLDNPFQAKIVLENIYENIKYLEMFPFLGKEIKNGYREIIAKYKYRIVYKIKNEKVYIISIFKYKNAWES